MFLTTMANTGQVLVPHPDQEPPNLTDLLEDEVAQREALHRLDLLSPTPAFNLAAAAWATKVLYRACQALVFRDISQDAVAQALQAPSPNLPDPSICYSVDVAFCFLPDLFSLARGISPDDPLVTGLSNLARAWPLSSVGMGDLGALEISPFIADPCLKELYLSRIIQRSDQTLAADPRVRAAIRQAVGAYHELAPQFVFTLNQENTLEH